MKSVDDYMLPCLNKTLFGYECPGCGLQRSVSFIIKGEFTDAFYIYPAIYALIPLALAILLSFFYKFKYSNKIINILAIVSVFVIIISFIMKKI